MRYLLILPLISISKNIRFTLFETDTKELKDYSDEYKYGIPYHNQKIKVSIFLYLKALYYKFL